MMWSLLLVLAQVGIDAGPAKASCNGSVVTLQAVPQNPPANYSIRWQDGSEDGVFLVVTPNQTTTYRVTLTDLDTQEVFEDTTQVLVSNGNSDLNQDGDRDDEDWQLWSTFWSGAANPDVDGDGDNQVSILDWFYLCNFDRFPPNSPPSLSVTDVFTVSGETAIVSYDLMDAEQIPFLFIDQQPQNGFVTNISGVLRYTPNVNYVGADSFELVASDGLIDTPPLTVPVEVLEPDTFTDLRTDIFVRECGACHIDAASGGLSLDTYEAAIGSGSINAGSPTTSSLWIRVADGTMPLNRPPLSLEETERIRLWILRGALP